MVESSRHGLSLVESITVPFALGQRHVADRLEQPPVVEPIDPFQRRVLHGIEGSPRTARVDHHGLDSRRRTKATLIYRRTKNLRAVQLLLGHRKLDYLPRRTMSLCWRGA